jgi:hypothetical protein
VKKRYTALYAQLCMQAQHKYLSGQTLSGRGIYGAGSHAQIHASRADLRCECMQCSVS